MTQAIGISQISKADIYVFRAPIREPVRTSFGIMYDRPAVILRLEDSEGAFGWGEAWCNFPGCGAEHRARLLETVYIPMLLGTVCENPAKTSADLAAKTRTLRLQTDEPGPLAQTLACVDIALWDLAARKIGAPLHAVLGTASYIPHPAYASGIHPAGAEETIARARTEGYRIFKVKIGFDEKHDIVAIQKSMAALRDGEQLAVDINQAWDLPAALSMIEKLNDFPLLWIEEPLPCDSPLKDWLTLSKASRNPLAAGENIRSIFAFEEAISCGAFAVIQPDICKWGGLSQCRKVAASLLRAGIRYCPHYLGGGVGLFASAHLLAASGGNGMLEIDCNPNPLREFLAQPFSKVENGHLSLSGLPGLGCEPDLAAVKECITFRKECS